MTQRATFSPMRENEQIILSQDQRQRLDLQEMAFVQKHRGLMLKKEK